MIMVEMRSSDVVIGNILMVVLIWGIKFIPYNNYLPMLKHPQIKPQPSFLQRFQGRNQKISREGLLQILLAKRSTNSELDKYPPPDQQQKKANQIPLERMHHYPSKIMEPLQGMKQSKTPQSKKYKSQELKNNASKSYKLINQNLTKLKNPQIQRTSLQSRSDIKLPLIQKSKSYNNIFIPKLQMIESDRMQRKKIKQGSYYSNRRQKQNEIDQYVLRHLQFLDKFQKQFINVRAREGAA